MTNQRPTLDAYYLQMTALVASRATCARRKVGCVLVDVNGHVMATGYNGVARGLPHCIDSPCEGANQPSGQGLHLCQAIHAEQNALLQCRSTHEIFAAYVTSSPCIQCMRLLANTSVQRIVFSERYPHVESERIAAQRGIQWIHHGSSGEDVPAVLL